MGSFMSQNSVPTSAGQGKTVSQMLGEITWLLSQSPVHRQLFVGDLEWFLMPPLLLEQYRVFYGPDRPAAVALYAKVSEEVSQRLQAGAHKLRADEWRSGDTNWLIELIAPFGGHQETFDDIRINLFKEGGFWHHKIDESGKRSAFFVS
jgi:cytolysin-activating lysine-acyltransferase